MGSAGPLVGGAGSLGRTKLSPADLRRGCLTGLFHVTWPQTLISSRTNWRLHSCTTSSHHPGGGAVEAWFSSSQTARRWIKNRWDIWTLSLLHWQPFSGGCSSVASLASGCFSYLAQPGFYILWALPQLLSQWSQLHPFPTHLRGIYSALVHPPHLFSITPSFCPGPFYIELFFSFLTFKPFCVLKSFSICSLFFIWSKKWPLHWITSPKIKLYLLRTRSFPAWTFATLSSRPNKIKVR